MIRSDHRTGMSNIILPFERWRLFRSSLLWAFEKTFERREEHYIPSPIAAWRILQGQIELRSEDGLQEIYSEGYWVFPRAVAGRIYFTPGTHIISIRFRAEWVHGMSIFNRKHSVLFSSLNCPLNKAAQSLVRYTKSLSEANPSGIPERGNFGEFLRMGPVFAQWIFSYYDTLIQQGAHFQSLNNLNDKVQQALEFMELQPLSKQLGSAKIAQHIGVSLSHLNKLFIQQIGMTPAAIWNRRKIAKAKESLAHGLESIKSISHHLGYTSPAHFSHWFRMNTETTPTDYRAQHETDYRIL
jgi:AraC-like DNA-binding protein